MDGGRLADRLAEVVALPDAALDARLRELEVQRRRLDAEIAETVAVASGRQVWAADGHRSMAGYLRATCNWSNGEVARYRSAARLIDAHPDVAEVWHDGQVGSAQVNELAKVHANTRVRDRLGEFVAVLVDQARRLSHREFQVVVSRFVQLADQDGSFDDRDAVEQRTATVVDVDGQLHVTASGGDRLTTAEFLAIFDRYVDAEFHKDLEARRAAEQAGTEVPMPRTRRQLRFDALIAMARSAAAHDGHAGPAEPLVSILVDQHTWSQILTRAGLAAAESLAGERVDPFTGLPDPGLLLNDLVGDPDTFTSRRCETTNGVALNPADVLRAALSGHVRRVVLGAAGRPIDLGRASRVFTGPARDAAKLLVSTCEHPGCELPAAWCQVDHATEWGDHGRTDQDNAGILCGPHNRTKHRQRLTTRRATDGSTHTIRADGSIILPVGHPPPVFDDPDDENQPGTLRLDWLDDDPDPPDPRESGWHVLTVHHDALATLTIADTN